MESHPNTQFDYPNTQFDYPNTQRISINHPYLLQVWRFVIAVELPTRDVRQLAFTCRGMYAIFKFVLAKRKKVRARKLAKKRKESRAHPQPQPQPQNGIHFQRLGKRSRWRLQDHNKNHLTALAISDYYGVRCTDIYVKECQEQFIEADGWVRYGPMILQVFIIEDGVVVSERSYTPLVFKSIFIEHLRKHGAAKRYGW